MPYTHFRYTPTPLNAKWQAYVAGPAMWFDCHTRGRSKPCLHLMTNGELTCPHCASDNPVSQIGYQPLYRFIDLRPVLVVVHDYHREQVDKLVFHRLCWVMRGDQKTDGVTVTPCASVEPRFSSTLPDRNRPVDLTRTLLRMWNIPELTAWYAHTHGISDNELSPPQKPTVAPAASSGMVEESPEEREARNRAFVANVKAGVAESATLQRPDVPTQNGKDRRKKP